MKENKSENCGMYLFFAYADTPIHNITHFNIIFQHFDLVSV